MSTTARKTDPKLWDQVKKSVTDGGKGGEPGQWSARKAQLAVQEYKKRGGSYVGSKRDDNSLSQWTEEDWGTRSGAKSGDTHERYLPRRARETLSGPEYERTTAKKRADARRGRQFSRQPEDVARKTAPFRKTGGGQPSKQALYEEARRRDLPNRSRMSKAELERALERR